jgi:hypothetical protein
MADEFHNKDGSLTRYALACGYVEKEYHNYPQGRAYTTLYMEHGVYNVRSFDYDNHTRILWESFPYLKDARRRYREVCSGR